MTFVNFEVWVPKTIATRLAKFCWKTGRHRNEVVETCLVAMLAAHSDKKRRVRKEKTKKSA